MKIKSLKYLPGFILILCINLYAYAQENNYFSPYLIGTYNLHMGNSIIQVVNPTAIHLSIYVAFFDDDENAQMCFTEKLSPNDLIVLNVNSLLPERRKPELAQIGIVKIVSFVGEKLSPKSVTPGIVGFQQNIGLRFFKRHATESNLAAIPQEILMKDLPIIIEKCDGVR